MELLRSLWEQVPAEVRLALMEFMMRPISGRFRNWHLLAVIFVLWVIHRYQQSRPHPIGNPPRR